MPPIKVSGIRLNGDLLLGKGDNFSILNQLRSERNTNWSIMIKHEWTASWSDASSAQQFFDNGGEIRHSGEAANPVFPQDVEWSDLLSNMGMMIINKDQTFSTGIGLGTNIGYDALTSTYQDVFKIESSLVYASFNYGVLEYIVQAKKDNDQTIHLQALLQSQELHGIDIVHFVDSKRNTNSPAPTFLTITELSDGGIT